jgi:tetratricopeptide (TPR) repeat protein
MTTTPKSTASRKKPVAAPPPLPVAGTEEAANTAQTPPEIPPVMPPVVPPYQYYAPPTNARRPGSGSFLKALTAAFLNLNGFGLGYFWSKGKTLGLIEIGGTAAVLAAAFFFQTMENKLYWLLGLLAWVLAHAVWGAIRAAKPEHQFGIQPALGVLFLVGIGALVIEGGLFAVLRAVGNVSQEAGAVAYHDEDFKVAANRYGLADAMYRLTFSDEMDGTTYYHGVSKLVVEIRDLIDSGSYADVPDKVDSLISKDPDLTGFAHNLGMEAILKLTADLEKTGDYEKAAEQYSFAMTTYKQADDYADAQEAYYNNLITWAGSLTAQDKFAEALAIYQRADSELSMVVDKHKDFISLIGNTYLDLSEQQQKGGDFASAIATLRDFQNDYPATSLDSEVRSRYPELYLLLARQQMKEKKYAGAVESYETLLSSYPNSSQAGDAQDEIAEAYLGYGDALAAEGNNEDAYEVYKKALALDIPEEDRVRVETALGTILLNIGKDQTGENLYIEAILSLTEAKTYTADETLIAEIDTALTDAVAQLAGDTGDQGDTVMDEAVTQACQAKPSVYDSVNYFTDGVGKALVCDGSGSLPSDLYASTPGELRYVVTFASATSTIESCPYYLTSGGSATIYRMRSSETVTIRYADTGKVYTSKTFYGGSPETCPYSHYFYGNTDYFYGSDVDYDEVDDWLSSVIK